LVRFLFRFFLAHFGYMAHLAGSEEREARYK